MYQEFFIQKGVLVMPIIAMLSFVLSFVAIFVWSMRAARKRQYDELAELPLQERGAVSANTQPEGLP